MTDGLPTLDLSILPPIFVSATHFTTTDLHVLEDELAAANATLTYDIHEARIVLSRVTRRARAQFDLRAKGLWTEEVATDRGTHGGSEPREAKKVKLTGQDNGGNLTEVIALDDDSSTASEGEGKLRRKAAQVRPSSPALSTQTSIVSVVRVEWFHQSKREGKIFPLDPFTTFRGRPISAPKEPLTPKSATPTTTNPKIPTHPSPSKAILERAKEDAPASKPHQNHHAHSHFTKRKHEHTTAGLRWEHGTTTSQPHLIQATTSENDGTTSELPESPEWVQKGLIYACQRSTPRTNPNEPFIALLKQIKLARLLTNDEIGVRAYSTSIASLSAYPYALTSPREILTIPGCEVKIANLFVEYKNSGTLKAVEDIESSEDLQILKFFYEIWGVGATTAREFYYERGWRDLDDIVEFGWSTLSRVQQIGVKYYDEFLDPIPRAEVEAIAAKVHEHAVKVRDERVQSLVVGGYRRGKEASGDVDIIVSHPDEDLTLNIVSEIVASLEDEGWVTHTLLLSLTSTNRGQQTLAFRTGGGGHGFDTLDKALVVWQDPSWPSKEADLEKDPKAKNPNIHRRVDIIVSPWRTVGCAVMGWSGGTTFQRDLRRYAKNVKGWKFDSSGVRSRVNGEVVDMEGWLGYEGSTGRGRARSMVQAEKRVFERLGLVYRAPEERCTS